MPTNTSHPPKGPATLNLFHRIGLFPSRLLPAHLRLWPARFSHRLTSDSGASLVEFALTFPILFGFVYGLMQVCLAYYTYEWISECSREGTRYAIVRGSTCITSAGASCTSDATAVNTFVTNDIGLPNLAGGALSVNTTYPDGDEVPGHRVKVNVTYTFPYKIPFVTSKSISMSTNSEMYIVQ